MIREGYLSKKTLTIKWKLSNWIHRISGLNIWQKLTFIPDTKFSAKVEREFPQPHPLRKSYNY